MALVTKNFTLNVTPGAMPPTVHVSEYDIGRTYAVQLLDENGSAYEIPTDTTATVEGTLNGTVGFTQSATVSNNQVSFTLAERMTAYAGRAWCKIKLTQNSQPIQTCAFVLAVDRAGVEAETVIGAPGFEEQIQTAVNNYLDEHPVSGEGWTEEMKTALLACFQNVAWINDQGQSYYDALYNALNPEPTPPIPDLPSGYTKYDYISADGNAYFQIQSISNHPVPLGYTVHAIAQQTTHSASASKVVAGGGSDNSYIGYAAYSSTAGRAGAYYGAEYNTFADFANLLTSKTDFVTKITAESVTTTTTNSGVSKTVTTPVGSTPTQDSTSIKIGYSGASGSNFVGKIYLVEVKNTSDVLTHQFVPCKRDSDSVAGMYDTVTSTFYASSGSSQFTAGND